MRTSLTKRGAGSDIASTGSTPTPESLLEPNVGMRPPSVRLIQGYARETLASLPTRSVSLILTSPPVEIFTKEGRAEETRFDSSWIEEAIRVSDSVIFTIHADAFRVVWEKSSLPKLPSRIGVWTIGEEGRFGIHAESANLILAYGLHPGLRSMPDCFVAPVGDGRWPPAEFHPSPGSYFLAYQIIDHMKPRSVLDPFLGSGVTLHAALTAGCEEILGIDREEKWLSMVRNEIESRGILPE